MKSRLQETKSKRQLTTRGAFVTASHDQSVLTFDAQMLAELGEFIKRQDRSKLRLRLGQIAATIPSPDDVSSKIKAQAVMEECGAIGLMLKKNGEFLLAMAFLNTLCQFARKFEPWSVDTAWDMLYYSECLINSGYKSHARGILTEARDILGKASCPSQSLSKKIRDQMSLCR